MISGRSLSVGRDSVNLADGTGTSGVSIQALRNRGKHPVWIGEVGNGYRLDPGESFPGTLTLGSTDSLPLVAELPSRAKKDDAVDVHAVLGYEEVIPQ